MSHLTNYKNYTSLTMTDKNIINRVCFILWCDFFNIIFKETLQFCCFFFTYIFLLVSKSLRNEICTSETFLQNCSRRESKRRSRHSVAFQLYYEGISTRRWGWFPGTGKRVTLRVEVGSVRIAAPGQDYYRDQEWKLETLPRGFRLSRISDNVSCRL